MKLLLLLATIMVTHMFPALVSAQVLKHSVTQTITIMDEKATESFLLMVYSNVLTDQIENLDTDKFSFSVDFPNQMKLIASTASITAVLHVHYTVTYDRSPLNCVDFETLKLTSKNICDMVYENVIEILQQHENLTSTETETALKT